MNNFRVDVILLLMASFATSVMLSKDINLELIKEEAEKPSLLTLQNITVQMPTDRTCGKHFLCEAEKSLNHVRHVKLAKLTRQLRKYNEKNGIKSCQVTNNATCDLSKLLEEISECAEKRLCRCLK